MSYTLYGSQTSPFVRRIRILMENIPFKFEDLNIFEAQDGVTLNKVNPINQVPVLTHGNLTIWDSRQIFNYLNSLHHFQKMDWKDENLITAIDGAMNAAVSLILMKRSGIKIDEPYMYVGRQKDRMESILDFLSPYIKNEGLREWNFVTISIYCYLDWAIFRGILDLSSRPDCLALLEAHKNRDIVINTQIPKV